MSEKIKKTDDEWRQQLSPEHFEITRQAGTERAFSGEFWDCKEEGIYLCRCCGSELFSSDTKYDSGSGWPSFTQPSEEAAVAEHGDNSLGMMRTEVTCARCDAHLGHVFPDGPAPTSQRYCINSASIDLKRGS